MEFQKFESIPRLSKDCTITEKLDGTHAQIIVTTMEGCFDGSDFAQSYALGVKDNLVIFADSRNRWLKIGNDNFGFADWGKNNSEELFDLGEGRHYGEWVGFRVQRGYGLKERRFYLFDTSKWNEGGTPEEFLTEKQSWCPPCCYVVPVLFEGVFTTENIESTLKTLKEHGSYIVPFLNPEGVVIYHKAAGSYFKKTFENDIHKYEKM